MGSSSAFETGATGGARLICRAPISTKPEPRASGEWLRRGCRLSRDVVKSSY
jgi:hypothetical protein